MSRVSRKISETGIYHIVFRGINKQDIFEEPSDYEKLLEIIRNIKKDINFEIYVYCLMSNHVHLMLKESKAGEISLIMKRLLTSYVMWYNKKYGRTGSLIAGRYKSMPIEIDEYFLCVVRYIHQNPIKAGIVDNLNEYRWSSFRAYNGKEDGITSREFVNDMLPFDEFMDFHMEEEKEVFIVDDKIRLTDYAIRRSIIKELGIDPKLIASLPKENKNELIIALKQKYTTRQIERITGISRGVISKR